MLKLPQHTLVTESVAAFTVGFVWDCVCGGSTFLGWGVGVWGSNSGGGVSVIAGWTAGSFVTILVVLGVDFVVSCLGFIIFGYVAVKAYENVTGDDKYIVTTVALAIIFLFSIYFSMKTLRAELIADLPGPDPHIDHPNTEDKINF